MTGAIKASQMAIVIIPQLESDGQGSWTWTGHSMVQWKGANAEDPKGAVSMILRQVVEKLEDRS
jgi:hypothetical protein